MFSLFNSFESALESGQHPAKFCDLNLPMGNSGIFTCDNGNLVSVIEIRGSRRFLGVEDHRKNVEALAKVLTPYFKSQQHDIGFFYEQDTDRSAVKAELSRIYSPIISASRALGLLNDELLNEEIDMMTPLVHLERSWLVCWTTKKANSQIKKSDSLPPNLARVLTSVDRQDLKKYTDYARRGSQHVSFVERVMDELRFLTFSVRQLPNSELVRNIRRCVDQRKTSEHWEPQLAGMDRGSFAYPSVGIGGKTKEAAAALLPPKVGYQVWPSEPEPHPEFKDMLIMGNRIYKVIALRTMPNGEAPFNKLLREASSYNIPFRFAGLMHSSGTNFIAAKYAFATILTVLPIPTPNKRIRDEIDYLSKLVRDHNIADTSIQICVATWAERGQESLLSERADRMLQIINGWRQADGYILRDDLLEGIMSTLPAYRNGSTAPAGVGPLEVALFQMPLTRPNLPFDKGAMCFRSEDGRPIPFQPFDYNVMRHHVYLVVGEPGFGKSATINNMMTALVMSSNDVPYIGISDIGTSSLGSVRLAQSILPEGKKHLALYHRFTNDVRNAYNILQTDYGLRAPIKEHFDEITNLLELMFADDRTQRLHPDMPGLIQAVLKLAYRMKDDTGPKSDPELYRTNRHNDPMWPEIARALDRIDFTPTEEDAWWEIFDKLHDAGEHRAAALVQRFAVPTLPFLASAATRAEIREEYPGNYDSGTPLVDYFARRIGELAERYPVLSETTQLDLGDARIVALDMEEVVPRASQHDYPLRKQGAIFVSVAARILTSRFFWKEDRLSSIPDRYKDYYRDSIRSIRQTTNVFMEDEVQRTAGIEQSDALRVKIANEGRKWEIGIILSSQNVTEMAERLLEFATLRIICGFTDKSIGEVVKKFKLSDTERELIIQRIRPPSKDGAWIYLMMEADDGSYSQLLNVRMGSQKLWGLSTRNRDALIRDSVYKEFDDEVGRRLLAKMYPSGSVEKEYETRLQRMSENEDMGLFSIKEINTNPNIIESIKDHIITTGKNVFANDLSNELRQGITHDA